MSHIDCINVDIGACSGRFSDRRLVTFTIPPFYKLYEYPPMPSAISLFDPLHLNGTPPDTLVCIRSKRVFRGLTNDLPCTYWTRSCKRSVVNPCKNACVSTMLILCTHLVSRPTWTSQCRYVEVFLVGCYLP
jgi:hypothetical protein